MAGLFTLDDESLGVLDANALGGFGTGFVVGSATSAGSVAGVLGYTGSVTGSQVSAGSVTGAAGFAGSVAGSQVSAGSVSGAEGNTGTISGVSSSAGSITGVKGSQGTVGGTSVPTGTVTGTLSVSVSVTGSSVSNGVVSGEPALSGSVSGSSVSAGSVTGNTPVPPEPPTPPAPSGGGDVGRWYVPPSLQRPQREGHTRVAASRTTGAVIGTGSRTGSVVSLQITDGFVRGLSHLVIPILIPPRDSVAERQASEDELFMLWVD